MQIQTAIESTNILTRELSELKNEYYRNENAFFYNIRNNYSNIKSKEINIDKRFKTINSDYQYYTQLIQSIDNYICITDKSGRVLEWSEGLKNIICINKNKIIGNYIWNIYNFIPIQKDVLTSEVLKLRELFLSCILTKRKYQLQNSEILNLINRDHKMTKINISISMINNNIKPLVLFVFKSK